MATEMKICYHALIDSNQLKVNQIIIMSLLKVPEVNIGDGCQIEKILKSQFL